VVLQMPLNLTGFENLSGLEASDTAPSHFFFLYLNPLRRTGRMNENLIYFENKNEPL
jgi:hypothetical protein